MDWHLRFSSSHHHITNQCRKRKEEWMKRSSRRSNWLGGRRKRKRLECVGAGREKDEEGRGKSHSGSSPFISLIQPAAVPAQYRGVGFGEEEEEGSVPQLLKEEKEEEGRGREEKHTTTTRGKQ